MEESQRRTITAIPPEEDAESSSPSCDEARRALELVYVYLKMQPERYLDPRDSSVFERIVKKLDS